MRKKNVVLLCCMLSFSMIFAQEKKEEVFSSKIGANLMSRYLWRGLTYGTGPNIQPWTRLKYKNLNFGSWGAFSTTGDYSEVILMAGITVKGVKLQINDSFTHRETSRETYYLDYSSDSTRHNVSLNLFFGGTKWLPLKVRVSTFVYGADKKENGDLYYSTYLKLSYIFGNGNTKYTVFSGFTPEEGMYRPNPGVVDVGVKIKQSFKISNTYKLPVSATVVYSPYYENMSFVFGIHI